MVRLSGGWTCGYCRGEMPGPCRCEPAGVPIDDLGEADPKDTRIADLERQLAEATRKRDARMEEADSENESLHNELAEANRKVEFYKNLHEEHCATGPCGAEYAAETAPKDGG